MITQGNCQYLYHWPGSGCRQLFDKERKLRAETLYRMMVGAKPRTPEEVAADYEIPVEAVHEAIHYCIHNEALLRQEFEEGLADMRARGLDRPPFVPADRKRDP